ncbi:MAG TPA: 4-hydroxy-3-methylbut-2-enyl diphosphate reductase [Ignavibacteriaceae bacterium]|nr:4-hydroxy-3-methylbut-2-enyl diphosphate reductase [Ignavibacteriaceae bacterium]
MKKFNIPEFYRSPVISRIKKARKDTDPRKKDFTPTELNFGPVIFYLARHFGFCYGVENAIDISYRIIEENNGKRIFLLSEMIHNPGVNSDLQDRGVKFIMDTSGRQLIDWNDLKQDDIVIIPAFGTTLEIQKKLNDIGIDPYKYNTTCPFVEKVWNRSAQLGKNEYTVIIHGKYLHEETRATFSHSINNSMAIIVRDLKEAEFLGNYILGKISLKEFNNLFQKKFSEGFNPEKDLEKIGVVNQTTMLASETQAIADYLKNVMIEKYGSDKLKDHYADTRDTLCYATYDNQESTIELIKQPADFAIVVGGYNSSNTQHIVGLCQEKHITYFISSAEKIRSLNSIIHFDLQTKSEKTSEKFIPSKTPVKVILTSGASCPDAEVDQVLHKILSLFGNVRSTEEVLSEVLGSN